MALRNPQHAFSKTLSDEHLATHSGSSSSSAASAEREVVHLTPDFDSDEGADDGVDGVDDDDDDDSDSDLDMGMGMGMGMRGGERAQNDSYKMQRWQPVHREKGKFKELKKADLDLDVDVDVDMDSDEDSYRDETRRRRRGSFSTVQSYQLYTPDEERTVVRKFDRKLVVFVALLYMLSFLDRSNIGNAKIAGLERDLHLDSNKYEWVVTAFYIAYICFEWMSILWKIIPAHIYITVIVLSWGIIASLQSIATSFAGLLVLRTLLGIGEAGFTGIPFYLSFFFKREELAFRTGIFLSAAPLATSFASSLAWGIVKLGERSPIAPWRLLFLVEGFPSVLVALFAWHHIPDSPNTASYLTTREKKIARLRLRHEVTSSPSAKTTPSSGLKIREVFLTFRDPKVYLTALMFFFSNMAFSSMPIFLPTILTHMGHSASTSQALSAPPYLLSFFSVLLTSYLSDKFCSRSPFLIFHALLSSLGYTLLALPPHFISPSIRYLAIYPACVGFFCVITILITWTLNNQPSSSRQGTGFAIMQMVGQCGPLVGTRLYPETQAPYYTEGMGVCAGVMFGVAGLGWGLRWWLGRENQRSGGRYGRLGGEGEGEDEEERGLVANENGNGKVKSRRDGKISFLYML
ncbi:putative major facilitator superfamily transporter protein [Botrytis cinerea BcDW1]|uniref:Putative major facilitator superfamily transporter protein n=1 Tax=Botryotinia fuckeliana (strain BcDW1) TaxID=1290391 RepID=M7UFA5_BOTF1|nr:putative major facilitator superfamily transporter protein [Botrytis cinerea BcDW1]